MTMDDYSLVYIFETSVDRGMLVILTIVYGPWPEM